MRNAFASELTALAAEDPRLVLLSGDIGNKLFDPFRAAHPERFLNCGVAEANMVGVAAGLALSGFRPITYTIASFATLRCFEQIRVDVCYHQLPVIIVGVGAGLSYAANGATHHACEDLACLRALPYMTVVAPGDAWEVRAALREAIALGGPVYLRLGKKGEATVHREVPPLVIGRGLTIRTGEDVCLLSTGTMLPAVLAAADRLAPLGVSASVVSHHTIKPLDEALLADAFDRYALVVTVEEHSLIGGLGSAVAEWLADRPAPRARLLRLGTADTFLHHAGGQDYARGCFGLTEDQIAARVLDARQVGAKDRVLH
ncbi:MAG: transketolase [Acidobacteriota bacterium]|nr:transketolase [Acidobacteriota bacterium]